jgi:hypothetical protein
LGKNDVMGSETNKSLARELEVSCAAKVPMFVT